MQASEGRNFDRVEVVCFLRFAHPEDARTFDSTGRNFNGIEKHLEWVSPNGFVNTVTRVHMYREEKLIVKTTVLCSIYLFHSTSTFKYPV